MSIYGNHFRKTDSELKMYIENVFLESILDEKANGIAKKISSLEESDKFAMMKVVSEDIESSELHEGVKENLVNYAANFISRTPNRNYGALDESALESILEYSGNETKNEAFKECLKDLEELMLYFFDCIDKMTDILDKYLSLIKKAKTPADLQKASKQMDDIRTDYIKWRKERSKKIDGVVTWNAYKKQIKMFNNKYSQISLEEKKAFSKKINDMLVKGMKKIFGWAKMNTKKEEVLKSAKYSGCYLDDLIKELDRIKSIDAAYHDRIYNNVAGLHNTVVDEYNYTYGDVQYINKTLNIEIEKGIVFKIVNTLLKK